jgi:cytoskeletal protein RodZ
MNKKLIISIIVIVLVGAGLFLFISKNKAPNSATENMPPENTTSDTSTQNNTSTGGTTSTSTQNNTSTTSTPPSSTGGTVVSGKLGQTITFAGVNGTLKEVVEDSRCPIGVQCIQAGTVRVKVRFSYGSLAQDVTLTLNQPFTMYGYTITLTDVKPEKKAGVTISSSDYVFTFLIK